jgi:hypothetical protein
MFHARRRVLWRGVRTSQGLIVSQAAEELRDEPRRHARVRRHRDRVRSRARMANAALAEKGHGTGDRLRVRVPPLAALPPRAHFACRYTSELGRSRSRPTRLHRAAVSCVQQHENHRSHRSSERSCPARGQALSPNSRPPPPASDARPARSLLCLAYPPTITPHVNAMEHVLARETEHDEHTRVRIIR